MTDLMQKSEVNIEIAEEVDQMFEYHPWYNEQILEGVYVHSALAEAIEAILQHVPPCPDRSAALRKIREARMDCNSAIAHKGKY
ncbi:MAG: hypothetical protein MN733_22670 [Nitrososphaera sp.]|nr:hypothetical protein [Nitrososphaera sp.]